MLYNKLFSTINNKKKNRLKVDQLYTSILPGRIVWEFIAEIYFWLYRNK